MSLPPLVSPAAGLSPAEVQRYSRHVVLPELGMQGQLRLKAARVLVVGAGGLGSPVLLYLAAAGVGTLGVVDDDVVEESNLQRQVLHTQADLGRAKVDSAADRITATNPNVTVRRHRERLTAGTALRLLRGYDLVIDGTDNFATRYLVNDACELAGLPYVWGSIYRFDGQVAVFWAAPPAGVEGVTYRDVFPVPPAPGLVPSCGEGGVLGVLCGAVGAVMATEAVKLICGVGTSLLGRILVYDALEMAWRPVPVRRDPTRRPARDLREETQPGLSEAFPVAEVSAPQLQARLQARAAGRDDFLLVDVREPGERAIVAIPGSVPLPLGRLQTEQGRAELAALAAGREVVLHCKSGARSATGARLLADAGIAPVVHLAGGVLAWVEQVQPAMPRY